MHRSSILISTILAMSTVLSATRGAYADADAVIGGIVAGMIATGIAESNKSYQPRSNRSRVRVTPSEDTRQIQISLNHFGFDAGQPDGVMGRKTRSAVSDFQQFLGYQPTGQMTVFEQQFLADSYAQSISGTSSSGSASPSAPRTVLIERRARLYPTEQAGAASNPTAIQIDQLNPDLSDSEAAQGDESLDRLVVAYEDIKNQVALLQTMMEHQQSKEAGPSKEVIVEALAEAIASQEILATGIEEQAKRTYNTPIYPDNANRTVTAIKASEIFPRIPYYVPGTTEIGEMWVVPTVTDDGYLKFLFNFMDPEAEYGRVRESVDLESVELPQVAEALKKVERWSDQAQKAEIRRNFLKRAYCVPEKDCAERKPGNSSTEVIFAIYEDGGTAAKIQRNKGSFSSSYNFSIKSAMLLVAYMEYMADIGSREFNAGSMTDDELDAIFK
jgi:peptidoglycan hydrolase-like protein with peptidoglycan-binding domain